MDLLVLLESYTCKPNTRVSSINGIRINSSKPSMQLIYRVSRFFISFLNLHPPPHLDRYVERAKANDTMRKDKEAESPESLPASTSLQRLPESVDQRYAASPPQISAAPSSAAVTDPTEENDDEDDDYEFAFVVRDPDAGSSITADEIFYNGQIRPVYPIFNRDLLLDEEETLREPLRRLMMEERETDISPPARSSDELKGISPETYCVWKPKSPEKCGKSVSTGSLLRFRIRDLVIRRSHSDGKEKFVFLETEKKKKEKGKKAREVDFLPANGRFYDRVGPVATAKPGGAGRKSFLPYKPNIVGFFAGVNGISRVHHPY